MVSLSAQKELCITADDAQSAIAAGPQLHEPWSEAVPELACTSVTAHLVPRTFLDWLWRRPPRWLVIASFAANPNSPAK